MVTRSGREVHEGTVQTIPSATDQDGTWPKQGGAAAPLQGAPSRRQTLRQRYSHLLPFAIISALPQPAAAAPHLGASRASVDARGTGGATALACAVRGGHVAAAAALLRAGADVDCVCSTGETALFAAVAHSSEAAVLLLLEVGADAERAWEGTAGWTPLMHAAASGHAAAVRLLLGAGADASRSRAAGALAPLHSTRHSDNAAAVRLLLGVGVGPICSNTAYNMRLNALSAAQHGGHLAVVELLLAAGTEGEQVVQVV